MSVIEQTPATKTASWPTGCGVSRLDERFQKALAFKAPYVIDRLVKDRVVDTAAVAENLFTEIKKYLVLCEVTHDMAFSMHSAMVDAAWHAFILFTAEYTDYGHRYFGKYLDHVPNLDHAGPEQSPEPRLHQSSDDHHQGDNPQRKAATFDDFRQRYETFFNQPLPDVWYDSNSIAPSRRMINDKAGLLTLVHHDHTVELIDDTDAGIISVNVLAYPALKFITETSDFYVRELPGNLTNDEKTGLVQALARSGVLRVTP